MQNQVPSAVQETSQYDVFLSFRGTDTRKTFADRLYWALVRAGFCTFRDKDEIGLGEHIDLTIENAIRRSTVSVVTLSQNFALSRSCLDELALIMERRRTAGHHVIPIFYHVRTSKVKEQADELATAFAVHEKHGEERIEVWKKALKEIREFRGRHLEDEYEEEVIAEIVDAVRKKVPLKEWPLSPFVAVSYPYNQIKLGLQNGIHVNAQKTISMTPSTAVFNPNSYHVSGSRFPAIFWDALGEYTLTLLPGGPLFGWTNGLQIERSSVTTATIEPTITEDSVNDSGKKLLQMPPGVFGREGLISDISRWVQSAEDVGIAILFGVGEIGKTTVAMIVYDSNCESFHRRSFLANVGEFSQDVNGLIHLLSELLSDLVKEKGTGVPTIEEGTKKLKVTTHTRRFLIVLDDVYDLDLFKLICAWQKLLSPVSKIIITTRNELLLRDDGIAKVFKVAELDHDSSLQLLSWHAFGECRPIRDYKQCLEKILRYCEKLPVVIKILGSYLAKRSLDYWEDVLRKLDDVNGVKTQKILKMSYEDLPTNYKNLFLDIVCFFIGKDKSEVGGILEARGYDVESGIQYLIGRCFLYIDENNKIGMHEMVVSMGREIICQESRETLGKCRRVLLDEDALHVLTKQIGTETIEGLSLNMRSPFRKDRVSHCKQGEAEASFGIKRHQSNFSFLDLLKCVCLWDALEATWGLTFRESNEMELKTDAFKNMRNLRLLRLNYAQLSGRYNKFPKDLVWLSWHGFPLESIPMGFQLANLVALELCNSMLMHDWKNGKDLPRLKCLDLSACNRLARTPDLRGLPSLERLILRDCMNLVEVDDSIGRLKRLAFLDLSGCGSLRNVSKALVVLESLKIDVSGCPMLQELPEGLAVIAR